jgi:hypothetical protein
VRSVHRRAFYPGISSRAERFQTMSGIASRTPGFRRPAHWLKSAEFTRVGLHIRVDNHVTPNGTLGRQSGNRREWRGEGNPDTVPSALKTHSG